MVYDTPSPEEETDERSQVLGRGPNHFRYRAECTGRNREIGQAYFVGGRA